MRDKTCPTWSNRSYSREKPKAEMEYMSTSNCSLHKNDLISLTLTTFSLLFVALKSWPPWMMAVGNLLMQWTIWSGIYSISAHFWLWFLTIVLHSREAWIWFWSSAAWPLTFWFLSFSIFLLLGCPSGKSQSKKGGRLVCAGKRQNDRRIRLSVPPFPALLLIFWFLRGRGG